ncbi:MAG: FUSC family protein [Flavipsychrobacter sp.]|nr:FUSC family protein [Flavipsychrobacter sp.]
MATIQTYKRLNKLIQQETFEPMFSWGLRMAISAIVPLIWGLSTNHIIDAVWITLTAEAVCWVELKGSYAWRVRTLASGAALAIIFSVLGSVTGHNIWLSTLCMFAVGFIATLLKNIGDRASGLAICVYLLFILSNAYPTPTLQATEHRAYLVLIGAIWPIAVGMAISLSTPAEQPFRRQIALIWRAVASLVGEVGKGWDGAERRSNIRAIYLKEKDVRTSIDNSFMFFTQMAHQVNEKDKQKYNLVQLRKAASLVAVHVIAMSEEMEAINISDVDPSLKIKLSVLFTSIHDTLERMAVFTVTLKPEEKVILNARTSRLKKLVLLSKQYPLPQEQPATKSIKKIIHLAERSLKLIERSVAHIEDMGSDVLTFRTYSMTKTLFILNPKFVLASLRTLFSFNTFNTRYALRSAIAASIGLFIYKWFNIDHGYWLPFSIMIVIQPYFGATFTKAIERVVGTLAGGIVGSLFLLIDRQVHIIEAILFITFVLMVYYLRRNYAIAAFVITVNLVLLFNLEATLNPLLIVTRALCTIGGSGLAVFAGFALLPTWDKKWLPIHLATSINCNYEYFLATFFGTKPNINWTKNKRSAETKNSNVFDSLNRYIHEPKSVDNSTLYYELVMHNIRVTRTLNNIYVEGDTQTGTIATGAQQQKINECLLWFNKIEEGIRYLYPSIKENLLQVNPSLHTPFQLTDAQLVYVEKLLVELKTMSIDIDELDDKKHVE